MKNYKLIFLILALVLVFVGCTQPAATPTETNPEEVKTAEEPTVAEPEEEEPEMEKPTGEGTEPAMDPALVEWSEDFPEGNVTDRQVLHDQDGVIISLEEVDYRKDNIYIFYDVVNNTEGQIEVGIERVNADGNDYSGKYYRVIPAGKKARMTSYVYYRDLRRLQIENINTITTSFSINHYGVDGPIYTDELVATTNLEAQEYVDPRDSGSLLYEDDNMEIYGMGFSTQNVEYGETEVYNLYIVNKSEYNLSYEIRNLVINDYVNEGSLYKEISAGGAGYADLYISIFDLDSIGVVMPEGIKNMEFHFEAFETLTYEPVLSSDTIKIEL